MKILIVGCGRTGSGLAKSMILRGHQVTVVDRDPASFENLGDQFKGRTLVGVGFDRQVLISAGIQQADAMAAVMANDEANVVAARIGKMIFRIPRVVARLNDPRQAEIYRRLGLQTISPVEWGINRIADLLLYSELDVVYSLGSGQVDLVEVDIPPLLVGRTVNELTIWGEIHVVAISRGSKTFLPTLGAMFQEGDRVHVASTAASNERLRQLLGK
jgi:trk/ktr system potassium uptake protein